MASDNDDNSITNFVTQRDNSQEEISKNAGSPQPARSEKSNDSKVFNRESTKFRNNRNRSPNLSSEKYESRAKNNLNEEPKVKNKK